MYNKLNITENTLRVLGVFTRGFTSDYYIREIQRILKISPRTAQLLLEDLEKKDILESVLRGKIKSYRLKQNPRAKKYLVLTEQYKYLCFTENNILIKEILERLTPSIKGFAAVFGSYAKNSQKKNSDLDIFVAGSYNEKEVENLSKIFGMDINIICYSLSIFEKKAHNDYLILEVLKNHIVFVGVELFIQKVLKDEKNKLV